MLQAITKEQRDYIKSLAIKESCDGKVSVWEDEISYEVDMCFNVSISFETMEKIVDYLRTSDKKDELFEECWLAYRRKGSKKKAKDYWKKLTDDEKSSVLSHIKAYVASRDVQFQKDFERYLRDKTFTTIVIRGNSTIYDPDQSGEYSPQADGIFQYWNAERHCLIFNGDIEHLDDGYTAENRPNGAKCAWGMYEWVWNGINKEWVKK